MPCQHAKHLGVLCAPVHSNDRNRELQLVAVSGVEQDRAELGVEPRSGSLAARRAGDAINVTHERALGSGTNESAVTALPRATTRPVGELEERSV